MENSRKIGVWTIFSAAILLLVGIVHLAGGIYLAWLGGSAYYALVGLSLIVASLLYWWENRWGERIYALTMVATIGWAMAEAGSNPWALGARTFAPAVLGFWLASPWVRRGFRNVGNPAIWRSESAICSALTAAILIISFVRFEAAAMVRAAPSPYSGTLVLKDTDWPHYGNSLRGDRFATPSQINAANVQNLEIAWVHRAGRLGDIMEATPIKIGDMLYTCGAGYVVYALDAKTGAEQWRSNPGAENDKYVSMCRGVSFYHTPGANGPCTDRILFTVPGSLRAIDAATGLACQNFGARGRVSLLEAMGHVDPSLYNTTSPPLVVSGLIIINSKVMDSRDQDAPSGVIKAFDAQSGALRWAWDMGAPDRIAAPAVGETFTRSTPNSWAPMSADESLGLLYVPMGNPMLDFYGVKRRAMDEKFGSALVALNISNGRPRWTFNTVHHDLWDYDLPAQPVLIDLTGPNGVRPAVVQGTKQGHVFVLDRRDGSPIFPVTEGAVPQGAAAGEMLSATQPRPQISLAPKPLTEADMWGATPLDQMWCRITFKRARYDGMFTPPGLLTSIQYPGSLGVIEWGGISVDPRAKVMIANTTDSAWTTRLVSRQEERHGGSNFLPQKNSPYAVLTKPFLGPLGMPCTQPPWGKLAAISLETGKVMWRNIIGTARDTGPLGTSIGLPLTIGQLNIGGTVTTGGGLTFMAATLDQYLRAYDTPTGRELWRIRLPAGGQATPMTYMAGGKQYIVLTVGGHAFAGTKRGDYTIAYALPDSPAKK